MNRVLFLSMLCSGAGCAQAGFGGVDVAPASDVGVGTDASGLEPDTAATPDARHPFAVDVPFRPEPDAGASDAGAPDTGFVDWRRDSGRTGCRADGESCSSYGECCGNRCTDDGRCAPESCMLVHERCFAHSECCDGVMCMGGFCGGPERTGTCAIDGVSCWAHTQCCSGVCNREGLCIAAAPPIPVCSGSFVGCLLSTSCCTNVCNPFTGTCADNTPGTWLP